MAQIQRFCTCWAKFFAEMPVAGRCWVNFFAPTGAVLRSCSDAAHFRLAAMGGLRHAKPSSGVSSACRSLGWRHSPRLVAVSSQFAVVSWPNCRPIGGKSPKTALLAEWVCDLAELVGVDASIALFGAASQADASRICQLGSTTGTLNPLMRS